MTDGETNELHDIYILFNTSLKSAILGYKYVDKEIYKKSTLLRIKAMKEVRDPFWRLKAKIDDMKKQIEDLRDLSQPRPLTEKEKKEMLAQFEDD